MFVAAGIILGPAGLGIVEFGLDDHSVLLHGVTAAPLSAAYARQVAGLAADAPEKKGAVEVPTRVVPTSEP